MWKIKLKNFQCWDSKEVNLKLGGVTLMKGKSGTGKSTILRAISWCLYGKLQSVEPKYSKNAATKVTLEFPNTLNGIKSTTKITRSKQPNRLLLNHASVNYEDRVAQSTINSMFGDYDIWQASCYVGDDGLRNLFFSLSISGKIDLLNKITFSDENGPKSFYEKLSSHQKQLEIDYRGKLAFYNSEKLKYQPVIDSTDLDKFIPDITEIENNINSLKETIDNLISANQERNIQIALLNRLKHDLVIAESELSSLKPVPKPQQSLDIEQLQSIKSMLLLRDEMQNRIKSHSKLPDRQYTVSDYEETLKIENEINSQEKQALLLDIPYDEIKIKEKIEQLQHLLDLQDQIKIHSEINELKNKIALLEKSLNLVPIEIPELHKNFPLEPNYDDFSTLDLNNTLNELSSEYGKNNAHVEHLEKGYDVLSCPHCEGSVRYQNNFLIKSESAPTNRDELVIAKKRSEEILCEMSQIKNKITDLNLAKTKTRKQYEFELQAEQRRIDDLKDKINKLTLLEQQRCLELESKQKQIDNYKSKIEQLSKKLTVTNLDKTHKLLSLDEIKNTHMTVAKLSNIKYIPKPDIPSQTIHKYLEYQRLLQEYNKHVLTIPNEYRDYTLNMIQNEINIANNYAIDLTKYNTDKPRLTKTVQSLISQINNIKVDEDHTSTIGDLQNRIKIQQDLLIYSNKAKHALDLRKSILDLEKEVNEINLELQDCGLMLEKITHRECKNLQDTVDSINLCIQNICETMFDVDICVTLELFKLVKSKNIMKPNPTFKVLHKGCEFNGAEGMSRGEKDRISLALTLALARLSNFPLLMLDETLSSLDSQLKHDVIKAIRHNLEDKAVLVIMHEGIEGVYDDVIDFGQ